MNSQFEAVESVGHLPPLHPGEMLREEFLAELGLSAERFAEMCRVDPQVIESIIAEKRDIDADLALRFGKVFGMSPEFWMHMQAHYELELARDRAGSSLDELETIHSAAE